MAKEYIGQEYATATQGKGLQQETWVVRLVTRLTVTFSVLVMLVSLGIIACCAIFFLSPVNGTSMMTTLNASGEDTDSAVACRVTTPHRGDIVISKLYQHQNKDAENSDTDYIKTRYPHQDSNGRYMLVIKRLIAVGGDQITVDRTPHADYTGNEADRTAYDYDYTIYLNGSKLDEPYLDPGFGKANGYNFIQLYNLLNDPAKAVHTDWRATQEGDCITVVDGVGVLTIPENYYFYLGDNRGGNLATYPEFNYSWDCAKLGPLPADQYVGTCLDVVDNKTNLPGYVWDKIVYYVFFGWAWQK